MEMSLDLKTELAKEEYVKTINEINQKYELPLTIVEIILNGICNEVHNMKNLQLQKEQETLAKINIKESDE